MATQALIDGNPRSGPATPARLARLKARRKLWLKVHLWLGLSLGLFLSVIGLTGSVLVFWQEIDAALNPGLYRAETAPGAAAANLEEILAAAQAAAPPGWASGGLYPPREPGMNFLAYFGYPEPTAAPEEAVSLNIAVDPHGAVAVGRRVFYHAWNPLRHCLMGFFFKLHYAFFLLDFGVVLVGIMAVLLVISTLTGLILWWPLDGKWRRVLTVKRRAGAVRFNHDLHQSFGFYTLAVLLALLVSGIYFNLPDQFGWLVAQFSAPTPEPAAAAAGDRQSAGLDAALAAASAEYPGGRLDSIAFTKAAPDLLTACFREVPALKGHVIDGRCLMLDRRDGRILQVRDPAHGTAGDVFLQWQWPLHSGQAFGWTGRILVFLTGLACPLLFVTGLIRWLQKQRASRFKRIVGAPLATVNHGEN